MHRALLLLVLVKARLQCFIGLVWLLASCAADPDWASVKREIRERYPDVMHVSPAELNAVLEQAGVQKPLLLDARSPEEYAVSHLPGAVLAPDEGRALELLRDIEPAREIIVYCSVGLRSSALAQLLMAGGFRKVRNLEGSIFAWANSGFPLVQGEQPASVVHPFDERWSKLLKAELRADPAELHSKAEDRPK